MNGQRTLLWLGLAVSAVAIFLSALDVTQWVRAWFGLPVVALVPGYAFVVSMDARGRLRGSERLALSLGTSLTLTIMLGLLVSISPAGLRRETWTASLGLFAILTSLLALHRTKGLRAGARREPLSAEWRGVLAQSAAVLALTATIAIALATAAAAPIIGSEQAVERGEASVMQLWAAPAREGSTEMTVGIDNPGAAGFVCVLRIKHGNAPATDRLLLVGADQSLSLSVQRAAEASIMFPTEISLLGRNGAQLRSLSVWQPFDPSTPSVRDMKG